MNCTPSLALTHSLLKHSPSLSRRVIEPTTWDPPANLTQPLEEVWQHEMDTYSDPLGFKNYGFDVSFMSPLLIVTSTRSPFLPHPTHSK